MCPNPRKKQERNKHNPVISTSSQMAPQAFKQVPTRRLMPLTPAMQQIPTMGIIMPTPAVQQYPPTLNTEEPVSDDDIPRSDSDLLPRDTRVFVAGLPLMHFLAIRRNLKVADRKAVDKLRRGLTNMRKLRQIHRLRRAVEAKERAIQAVYAQIAVFEAEQGQGEAAPTALQLGAVEE